MTPEHFTSLYRELIDDNPLAVRAVLKILTVAFTDAVPTLAVTCEARPTLKVNLAFVRAHCRTDDEVKAVVVHEFLHVLLRHTEQFTAITEAEHLALDAVINAVIHRTMGPAASRLMSRYYADEEGVRALLRPPTPSEANANYRAVRPRSRASAPRRQLARAWRGLYDGLLVADDIRDLAKELMPPRRSNTLLLGNHEPDQRHPPGEAAEVLADALDTALTSMNGSGLFRAPKGRGVGASAYQAVVPGARAALTRWQRQTYEILRRHVVPDINSAREAQPTETLLPVLSPRDRRAALRATWSPFLPDARWASERSRPVGSTYVYLDASGSMTAELPLLVTLLARLSAYIRRPFWAFSDVVAPARIEHGQLVADTTGGTSMQCVLAHLARHRPPSAVVITDGYIEHISAADVASIGATRLHILVTRDGTTTPFARLRLPYTQLGKVPQ